MYLYHDSRRKEFRSPFGAAAVGTEITISLEAKDVENTRLFLRLWQDHEILIPMEKVSETRYQAVFSAPEEPCLLWYYFVAESPNGHTYYGHPPGSQKGTGEITVQPESWQITVYVPESLPEWYDGSVVYQIFPDRFARGDNWQECQKNAAHSEDWVGTKRMVMQEWKDVPFYCKDEKGRVTRWPFFGGNFKGIQDKLPYLKSMNVGVIYLNPIFLASSNHKYDTADYLTIDPSFGTEEDFTELCTAANALGIHIILDGVFSHTGDDSVYFNRWGNFPEPGAFSEEASPYDGWYRFGQEHKDGYECWWGVDSLPNVEETNESYQELICGENGVIRKWLRLGASGWRLDVADELPDSFIAKIRAAAKAEKPDALILGEVWEDASNKISYGQLRAYFLGKELDCTMHYPFRTGAIDFILGKQSAEEFADAMETIREHYPPSAQAGALNLLGTHDTMRILTLLGDAPENLSVTEQEYYTLPGDKHQLALQRLRLLDVMLFTFPGVPCVYYGDEAGMQGFADPFNRGTFPWGKEDGSLQFFVRMLSHLRKEYPVLRHGTASCFAPKPEVFGLRRQLNDTEALIYVNQSLYEQTISAADSREYLDLLSGKVISGETLTIPAMTAMVLYREGDGKTFSALPDAARTPTGKGILLPIFSLPNETDCGTMGKSAYEFLDAIHAAGYGNWMLLPFCPAGLCNSPYSSRGAFAGDPRFIDPESPTTMDTYEAFLEDNAYWLEDYAIYTVLREAFDGKPWQEWPWRERDRKNLPAVRRRFAGEIQAVMEEQYRFFAQWHKLRQYAHKLGITLIGDLPIYVAVNSADTWAHRELFQLDSHGYPILRAGCPPDYFTSEGQDWGNPLYNWEAMEQDGFRWWKERLRLSFRRFDYVRLDHFRAFAAYYAIPSGQTALYGYWMKGPGVKFFREMADTFGTLPIIAEDLGTLDSEVTVLLKHTGLSGMNIWQFTGAEMEHMDPEVAAHRVFFSGNHDNQTLKGFLTDLQDPRDPKDILAMLEKLPASAVIFPVQDILGLGDEARINIPGVATGNWCWRMSEDALSLLRKGGFL